MEEANIKVKNDANANTKFFIIEINF
jgi:hypothetical protein